jgi:putative tricarboxylic transport membrane protein
MDLLFSNLIDILTPSTLLLVFGGVIMGIVFGAIPGLTAGMAIALCLPFTFRIEFIPSFALLLSLYLGGISGGLIAAILINIPGTPASVATTFDGFPMAEKGEAGKALATGVVFSFIGTMFGILVLMFVAPPLGRIALRFGVFEYFSVAVFSLTMVSALSGKSLIRGLIACLIGIFLHSIGAAPIDGFPRFTFGIHEFDAGFAQVPSLVGLFALAEVLKAAKQGSKLNIKARNTRIKGLGFTLAEFWKQIPNALRSSAIGTGIGILPGIGAATCNILSYGVAKKMSKHPEKFGTGIMDGVVASESSNNASIGGAMVPLITLGIPGDAVTAILLGAFTMQGLQPGPMFISTNVALIYSIFALMLLASAATVIIQFFGMRVFVRVLKIPKGILLPMVMVMCMIGAFGVNNRIFDIWTLLIFGSVGFILSKFEFPLTPVVMGYVLGPIVEVNLRRGLMMSRGTFLTFLTRPISCGFLIVALVIVVYTVISNLRMLKKRAGASQVRNKA